MSLIPPPWRQLLWCPHINNDLMSLSIRGRGRVVCCFSPLFQVWFCRVAEMLFSPLSPSLIGLGERLEHQRSRQISRFMTTEMQTECQFPCIRGEPAYSNSQELRVLPRDLPWWWQKQPATVIPLLKEACELQLFTPLMFCLHQGAQLTILELHSRLWGEAWRPHYQGGSERWSLELYQLALQGSTATSVFTRAMLLIVMGSLTNRGIFALLHISGTNRMSASAFNAFPDDPSIIASCAPASRIHDSLCIQYLQVSANASHRSTLDTLSFYYNFYYFYFYYETYGFVNA